MPAPPEASERAQPTIVGIGVSVAVAPLWMVLPTAFARGQSIRKLADQVDAMRGDVALFESTADRLDEPMTGSDADPARVLAQTLGITAIMGGPTPAS